MMRFSASDFCFRDGFCRLPRRLTQTGAFAVSGDSRNCGDFVMPAIAAATKAENDAFYWHLGDFRWMSQPDQDLVVDAAGGQAAFDR